jgi:hypothetical protein
MELVFYVFFIWKHNKALPKLKILPKSVTTQLLKRSPPLSPSISFVFLMAFWFPFCLSMETVSPTAGMAAQFSGHFSALSYSASQKKL